MKNTLNGLAVKRVGGQNGTVFVPLPPALWGISAFGTGCACGKCGGIGAWDTLAISASPHKGDRTWTCHYPELQAGSPEEYMRLALLSPGASLVPATPAPCPSCSRSVLADGSPAQGVTCETCALNAKARDAVQARKVVRS